MAQYIKKRATGDIDLSYYDPRIAPLVPSELDDEFIGPLSNVWVASQPYDEILNLAAPDGNFHLSTSYTKSWLLMQGVDDNSYLARSISVLSKSTPFTIAIRFDCIPRITQPNTGFHVELRAQNNTWYLLRVGHNTWNGRLCVSSTVFNGGWAYNVSGSEQAGVSYLMFQYGGNNKLTTLFSNDGVGWTMLDYEFDLGMMNAFSQIRFIPNNRYGIVGVDFFRVFIGENRLFIGRVPD